MGERAFGEETIFAYRPNEIAYMEKIHEQTLPGAYIQDFTIRNFIFASLEYDTIGTTTMR